MELGEHRFWRVFLWPQRGALVFLLVFAGISSLAQPVRAATLVAASPASVTISAAITPARIIIVDQHGIIQKILSNTRQVVEPTVHQGAYDGLDIVYTPDIRRQYQDIMQTYALWRVRGVAYDASISPPARKGSALFALPTGRLGLFAQTLRYPTAHTFAQ